MDFYNLDRDINISVAYALGYKWEIEDSGLGVYGTGEFQLEKNGCVIAIYYAWDEKDALQWLDLKYTSWTQKKEYAYELYCELVKRGYSFDIKRTTKSIIFSPENKDTHIYYMDFFGRNVNETICEMFVRLSKFSCKDAESMMDNFFPKLTHYSNGVPIVVESVVPYTQEDRFLIAYFDALPHISIKIPNSNIKELFEKSRWEG